jgi:hypothetical protein
VAKWVVTESEDNPEIMKELNKLSCTHEALSRCFCVAATALAAMKLIVDLSFVVHGEVLDRQAPHLLLE